jgi:hypothetical protein
MSKFDEDTRKRKELSEIVNEYRENIGLAIDLSDSEKGLSNEEATFIMYQVSLLASVMKNAKDDGIFEKVPSITGREKYSEIAELDNTYTNV